MSSNKQWVDYLIAVHGELMKVQDNDRSLVVVANSFLELLISMLVKSKLRNGKRINKDQRTYSYAVVLTILNETRVLNDETYTMLDRFRKLRNRAAHKAEFEISLEELQFFDEQFKNLPKSDLGLVHTCMRIIGSIWNSNRELFIGELSSSAVSGD